LEYYLYTDSDVNPTDVQIDRGCSIYKEEKCDVIIGVGGGSNLDTAKSIGIIATNPGSIRDNFVPNYVTNPLRYS
jgi:alcohol dehydrogenase class IV